ncbi:MULTISPECIES: asparaginase [unclassified Moorena]|uniref:asparaginase n=1 Tax=unclassified Moorena TaxID=2683338 RepID=UPI0013CD7E15|nr:MULTISPECIES: asparaginase [unclassified Moorena]NEO20604.1 asparaginase [Moorena sp. SIO4A5]NEQ58577.1 asparaginase [Moorena sp. SIO4A1]
MALLPKVTCSLFPVTYSLFPSILYNLVANKFYDCFMNIGILYTGGTIGSVQGPDGLYPLDTVGFQKAFDENILPIIQSQYPDCTIGYIDIGFGPNNSTLDSTNLQPQDWCTIAIAILEAYDSYESFIVLHGTDTMAWTASILSFLMTGLDSDGNYNALLSKPLVVTGSQLPLFVEKADSSYTVRFNTDALQNVCGAVTSCCEGVPEVCLYFDSTLMRGNRTVKTNASEFKAFSTPNYPNIGEYGLDFDVDNKVVRPLPTDPSLALSVKGEPAYDALSAQLTYINDNINSITILPFSAFPAYYDVSADPNTSVLGDMLAACINQGVDGLILESYGAGNFPSGNPDTPENGAIYKVLDEADNNGTVIVDCTQVLSGIVNSQTYAAGSWLSQVGAVGAYDMTPIAAATKLTYLKLLAKYYNWDQYKIKELMMTNLVGEIMDVNVLDARGEGFLAPGETIMALDGTAILTNEPGQGPVLTGTSLEEPFVFLEDPSSAKLPGQLHMQEDGQLIFYDRDNQAVYQAGGEPDPDTRSSKLILEGETTDGGTKLYIENYGKEPFYIYPEQSDAKGKNKSQGKGKKK